MVNKTVTQPKNAIQRTVRKAVLALDTLHKDAQPNVVAETLTGAGFKYLGSGSFKAAFVKGKVVVKIAGLIEDDNAHDRKVGLRTDGTMPKQWQSKRLPDQEKPSVWATWYAAYKPKYQRYLAKPLYVTDQALFQPVVPGVLPNDEFCLADKCQNIAREMGLSDHEHNHGHTADGDPIFYDCRFNKHRVKMHTLRLGKVDMQAIAARQVALLWQEVYYGGFIYQEDAVIHQHSAFADALPGLKDMADY